MSDLRVIAVHEAGHAVGHRAQGLTIRRVWIADDAGYTEHAGPVWRPGATATDMMLAHATAALCAPAAVRQLIPTADPDDGAYGDHDEAWRLVQRITTNRRLADAYLERAYERAERIVAQHAAAILALADELLAHGSLTGSQVRELCRPYLRRADSCLLITI